MSSETRRELKFSEESKGVYMPPATQEDVSSILSSARKPKTESRTKMQSQPICPPPPSFAFASTTAHKLRKRTPATGEESKARAEPGTNTARHAREDSASFAQSVTQTGADVSPSRDRAECCVTIFGYTPVTRDEVVREVEKYGEVIEYQEKGRNWTHLRLARPQQARDIFKLNGCLINRLGIVVGAKRCEDRDFCCAAVSDSRVEDADRADLRIPVPRRTRGWVTKFVEYVLNW